MPELTPIHDLPFPRSTLLRPKLHRKRKRSPRTEDGEAEAGVISDGEDEDIEYTAVVTPDERAQRRLAGYELNHPPPPLPFPHAPQSSGRRGPDREDVTLLSDRIGSLATKQPYSLRGQHLSVMTALLHKCLWQKDFARASRVIAVLLRTEVSGRSIDSRHAGLWGMAAEVLMRDAKADQSITREGLERARNFCNKMALQHPWHRSWPSVVNAQDFKLAMLSLWIYAVKVESKRMQTQDTDQDVDDPTLSTSDDLMAKRWELAEAEAIAKEMDLLMSTLPFTDDLELIKLRAMVALWTADVAEAIDVHTAESTGVTNLQEQHFHDAWSADIYDHDRNSNAQVNEKATTSRDLAKTLFSKLGLHQVGSSAVEEDNDEQEA